MSKLAQRHTIDLAASAARVRSARRLASEQARQVTAAVDGADHMSIDLLFLLEESVLVMTDTHVLLEKLAGLTGPDRNPVLPEPKTPQLSSTPPRERSVRRALASAAALALGIVASAWALEVVDPAPMDVEAGLFRLLQR